MGAQAPKIEGGRLHGEPRKTTNCQNWGGGGGGGGGGRWALARVWALARDIIFKVLAK